MRLVNSDDCLFFPLDVIEQFRQPDGRFREWEFGIDLVVLQILFSRKCLLA